MRIAINTYLDQVSNNTRHTRHEDIIDRLDLD